jgi:hypothetical protein
MTRKYLLLFLVFPWLPLYAQVNNSAIIYADQYTTLTYQQIVDTVCPAAGCTIYATSPNASRTIGTLDPGSKVVSIYLGPFTYNVNYIILRRGMRVIGMGATPVGTILQSTNTANHGLFELPQTNNTPVTDVYLYGFRLLATPDNTAQWGILLDCSNLINSGLWHSTFEDLYFSGFQADAMVFYGPTSGVPSANQLLSLRNIWAYRPNVNAGPDLRIEGANGQIDCIECHFDGPPGGSAGDGGYGNVFIGNLSGGTQTPYSIHFFNSTVQGANIGVQIHGGQHISFIGSHHEDLHGAYLISNQGNVPTQDIWIANTLFAGNVGTNGGNGYIVNATNAGGIVLDAPMFNGTPDVIAAGPAAAAVSIVNPFSGVSGPLTSSMAGGLSVGQNLTAASGTIYGDLNVLGTLYKSAGFFKIDHPLDPDRKYLVHSFVESPDMKNMYDGVVRLNRKGEAEIHLPDWFQALNQEFRYQLTCIGGSAPVYVAQEIRNNRFKIAGGRPGLKVSWQLTGIRHDAYANSHRPPVEEAKPEKDRVHSPGSE